jgi:hypothetical protein
VFNLGLTLSRCASEGIIPIFNALLRLMTQIACWEATSTLTYFPNMTSGKQSARFEK